MKIKNVFLIIVFTMVFSHALYSQDEEFEVEVPEPPEFEFHFQDFHQMSEKDEQELLKNLKKDLRVELEVLKDFNKDKYFQFLRESQYKNMKFPFVAKREKLMHERERKIFEAEVKTESLAAKYGHAKGSEKQKIKSEMMQELTKLFEQKELRRKQEVEQLENELKELKKSLAVRESNKQDIIERRMRELLNEDQYLNWD